MNPSTNTC